MSKANFARMMAAGLLFIMTGFLASASGKVEIQSFPWESNGQSIKPSCLYMEGGFLITEKGCPDWGTSNPSLIQFIGDNLGQVVITYADGKEESVPLVIGYTIWIHGIWMENPAPFKGSHAEPEYSKLLQDALYLKGGFEGSERGLLRIASGVLQTNITNLRERTDDDGMIHTSYKDAPSWRYDGFGPFKPGKEKAKVKLNGKKYTIALEDSGDSSWGWVTVR